MPSHLCKCGHCTADTSTKNLYQSKIIETRRNLFMTLLNALNNTAESLGRVKKFSDPDIGKTISSLKENVRNLHSNLINEYEYFNFNK